MTVRILAAIAILAASPVAARQTDPAPPETPRGPTRLINPSAFEQQTKIEGDLWRNSLSEQATFITSPARMSRAERLAEMINQGQCERAHAIALEENDRRLARRISQLCSLED